MSIEKLSAENDFIFDSKINIPTFKIHDYNLFGKFINNLNDKIGRKVYFSIEELYHLGIIINLDVGYLIHISSTTNFKNNFIFGLTVDTKLVLKNIIESCDYCQSPKAELDLVFRWVKLLFTENNIELVTKKRSRFPIEYTTCLYEDDTVLQEKKLGILSIYQEPEPLIPIYSTYQCDFCLKSFENLRFVRSHINEKHDLPEKYKAANFVSSSYSQKIPVGLITVLVSERFLNYQLSYQPLYKTKLIPYSIPENFPELDTDEIQIQNNQLGYTINEISEFDEMFSFNYIIKFINNLQISDFNYYLDYLKIDTRHMRMKKFLSYLIFNCIVCQTKNYQYDTTLTTHRDKILKFYISSANHPCFIFNKISNLEKIMLYSNILSKSLLILFASYNLKKEKIPIYRDKPQFKIPFTHNQKKLLNSLFTFTLKNYKSELPVLYSEEEIKNESFMPTLSGTALIFWNDFSDLLIDFALQPKKKHTPLQSIFSFASCEYDPSLNKLQISRPPKRGMIFRGLLYVIRLSFLSNISHVSDEYYSTLITEATINGELRRVIEKMYYPTLYYYLKRKAAILQPFFNPEKFTYVHPVCLVDKFVGCKILGLYSINIMLEKTIKFIDKEFLYLQELHELDYKFDENENKLIRTIMELENELKIRKENDDGTEDKNYVHSVTAEFRKSISGITCLLIGYLFLTNAPLRHFKDYLSISYDSLHFNDTYLEIKTVSQIIIVEDLNIIKQFRKYQLIRLLLVKTNEIADKNNFFIDFPQVKPSIYFELMSCRYSSYRHFRAFLKAAHGRNQKMGEEYSKNWITLIKSQPRERSEGYLVINLKLIAPDNQKYTGEDYKDTVDPRSYLSFEDKWNLKDVIESGFLDYVFGDSVTKNYIQNDSDGDIDHNHIQEESKDYMEIIERTKKNFGFPQRKKIKI
jgi:hypothetical protein